jgi:hypothetical protein
MYLWSSKTSFQPYSSRAHLQHIVSYAGIVVMSSVGGETPTRPESQTRLMPLACLVAGNLAAASKERVDKAKGLAHNPFGIDWRMIND